MNAGRTSYSRAVAGYDDAFERRLVDVITTAIPEASVASDAPVLMLRTGETASALLTVLAGTLALSPSATRSPTATRKMVDDLHRKLRRQIVAAESDPGLADFLKHAFRGGDAGGHA